MSVIQIISLEDPTRVIDRTPRIEWQYVDNTPGHNQSKYRICLVKLPSTEIIPANASDGTIVYNVSVTHNFKEFGISNLDQTTGNFYHDITTPLTQGDYTVYVMSYDKMSNNGAGEWSNPASLNFTVINTQEIIYRFSRNSNLDTANFGNYWTTTNIDINDNPDRAKLSVLNSTMYQDGFFILEKDGGYAGIVWDSITYSASIPSGTLITFYARAGEDATALETASWSKPITSSSLLVYANQLHLTGRYIQIMASISTNAEKSSTPVLNYMTVNYTTPAISGSLQTVSIDDFYVVQPKVAPYNNFNFTYNQTTPDADKNVRLLANPEISESIYSATGYDIIKLKLDYPVNFMYIMSDSEIPATSSINFQFKSFIDSDNEEDIPWTPVDGSPNPLYLVNGIVSINSFSTNNLHIKVNFNATTDTYDTPKMTNMSLFFEVNVRPGVCYLYSYNFMLDSKLKRIILTSNNNTSLTRNCTIQYGISCNGSTNFNEYQLITKNRLVKNIANPGKSLKIGVKLTSGSLIYLPIIYDIGFIVEDVNGNNYYLNEQS